MRSEAEKKTKKRIVVPRGWIMAHVVPGPPRASKMARRESKQAMDEAIKPAALLRSLLDDPIRFVGSSRDELKASMSLDAARAAHFEVVNAEDDEKQPQPKEKEEAPAPRMLYAHRIIPRLPRAHTAGLHNRGNTCYMNSVMQALLHTPPLASALLSQSTPTLLGRYGVPHTQKQALKAAHMFNAMGVLKDFFERAYGSSSAISPTAFINNLRKFARPLRPGRQEDAHEYLRLLLEALQHASTCFAPKDIKPQDPELATTLVQRIFGGRLRSRVTCHSCRHNSDTYDPVMDLSLDVRKGIHSVKQALEAFTAPEELADKYRCDQCHKSVNATKRFSIEQTPMVLTVHLKRFGIFGNKINKPISYAERLQLGRYMSERTADTDAYRLYAIVHHYGSGPNVGHYVASVRTPEGRWLRMDDSYVSTLSQCPLDDPSAYILFYARDAATTPSSPRKRKDHSDVDAVVGEAVPRSAAWDDDEDEEDASRSPPHSKKDARRRKRRKRAVARLA